MKIPLSESDFLLLLRRYMKDGYLVNYVAFLKHIDNIIAYLGEHHLLDNSHVSTKQISKEFAVTQKPTYKIKEGDDRVSLEFNW